MTVLMSRRPATSQNPATTSPDATSPYHPPRRGETTKGELVTSGSPLGALLVSHAQGSFPGGRGAVPARRGL
jgi:hypothetical protein